MDVRRVVTGHDASGRSVFVSDGTVMPDERLLLPGATTARLAVFMCGARHSVVRLAE
jgi:hypothetical protein